MPNKLNTPMKKQMSSPHKHIFSIQRQGAHITLVILEYMKNMLYHMGGGVTPGWFWYGCLFTNMRKRTEGVPKPS